MSLLGLTSIHAVQIQYASIAKDGAKARVISWLPVTGAPTRSRIVPVNLREIESFSKKGHEISCKAYFTSDPQMDSTNRLVFNGQVYEYVASCDFDNVGRLWVVYLKLRDTMPANVP